MQFARGDSEVISTAIARRMRPATHLPIARLFGRFFCSEREGRGSAPPNTGVRWFGVAHGFEDDDDQGPDDAWRVRTAHRGAQTSCRTWATLGRWGSRTGELCYVYGLATFSQVPCILQKGAAQRTASYSPSNPVKVTVFTAMNCAPRARTRTSRSQNSNCVS